MRIRKKNGRIDREMLLLLAIGSFMAAIGILGMWSVCAGICLDRLKVGDIAGMLAGLTGCLFGILLLAGQPKKRP